MDSLASIDKANFRKTSSARHATASTIVYTNSDKLDLVLCVLCKIRVLNWKTPRAEYVLGFCGRFHV